MRKYLLLLIALFIMYMSNTPELKVLEPSSWINQPHYENNVQDLSFLKNKNSTFYIPYQIENTKNLDFFLHKLSHIIFYSLLTSLLFMNINLKKARYLSTWAFIVMFATLDEIHQYFIVGRSGRLFDIMLDATASLLTLFLLYFIEKNRKKKGEITRFKVRKKQQEILKKQTF